MMKKIVLYTLLITSFYLTQLFGQEPVMVHYGPKDGLPCSETYHLMQDSKGYIWVATNAGVSRFDGVEFKNFDKTNGLGDNIIFEIYEDYKNRIWFISYNMQLSYFYHDSIYSFPHNNLISEFLNKKVEPYKSSFYVDSSDHVYITSVNSPLLKVGFDGSFETISHDNVPGFHKIDNEYLVSNPQKTEENFIRVQSNNTERNFLLGNKLDMVPGQFYFTEIDNYFILADQRQLYFLVENELSPKIDFDSQIIYTHKSDKNNIWISLLNNGIYQYDINNCSQYQKHFLKNKSVSSVMVDKEGAYWFSTLSDGIYYLPNLNINKTALSENINIPITKLASSENALFIGYRKSHYAILHNGVTSYFSFADPLTTLRDTYYDPYMKRFIIGNSNESFSINNHNTESVVPKINTAKTFLASETGHLWVASTYLYKTKNNDIIEQYNFDKQKILSLYEAYPGKIYIGAREGIWSIRDTVLQYITEDSPMFQLPITSITGISDSLVLFGSNGNGIIVKKVSGWSIINQTDGLASNTINSLLHWENKFWVATPRGLNSIEFTDSGNLVKNYHLLSHLVNYEIFDIAVFKNKLYLATNNGLINFHPDSINYRTEPIPLSFQKINDESNPDKWANLKELDYNENSISFTFTGYSYHNPKNMDFEYRLVGLTDHWKKTPSRTIQFNNLLPNQYRFELKASNANTNVLVYEFEIRSPYWKQWWFLIVISFLFASLIWAIYYLRIKEIKKTNELSYRMDNYKQQALRQQMNPHFIFNTLNSIQYFILEEDSLASHNYLTKFAKLMRLTLDNSQEPFVSLEEELEALEIYLELENLRFDNRFTYTIKVSQEVNEYKVKIPTLLIQPFVENSIWHGIMHKKGKGSLLIEVTREGEVIKCIVEDDGVGRERAMEIQKSKKGEKSSLGSKITNERLKVLSSLYNKNIEVKYVDLKDKQGLAIGTRVEITMPYS